MTTADQRGTRKEKLRDEVFPDAAKDVFEAKKGGFVPIPIEYRLLLRHLSAAQIRLLLYLHLRTGKEGVCFPTIDEIAHDLGVNTPRHIRPLVNELERKGFIRTAHKRGRPYYLMLEPTLTILKLRELKVMSDEQLREINDVRESIKRDPVELDKE
jgi:DNA-binding transcriptional regulator YhcF (GntR family)